MSELLRRSLGLVKEESEPDYLRFTANTASNIGFFINGTLKTTPAISYHINQDDWVAYTFGTYISLAQGDYVEFKGNNSSWSDSSSACIELYCRANSSVAASGNIMSVLDETCKSTVIPTPYCFTQMFCNSCLTSAPRLPATTLTKHCYFRMFYQCRGLTTIPELPATSLAPWCYYNMFELCSGLTTISSVLPATTLADHCYYGMFYECRGLTTAALTLPATTLASYCYCTMFYCCVKLTTVPVLPATTLADNCYSSMFGACISLIVSDTSGSGYDKAWTIPKSGTFSNTYSQTYMFGGCKTGSGRASDAMAGEAGKSYTYYTQNIPVE